MAIWAGIITAVVAAGLSAGVAAASAPDIPSGKSTSRKVAMANLKTLPGQRAVDMAAKLGQEVTYDTGKTTKGQRVDLPIEQARAEGWISESDYQAYKAAGKETALVKIPKQKIFKTADFTGYGDAEVQGKLGRELAQIQLELGKKYGVDFANEARKQAELADPEGTAARKLLADEINRMEDERLTRQRPVAGALDAQILDEIQRGSGVSDAVAGGTAGVLSRRGDATVGAGDVIAELEAGPMGEARKSERLQKAMAFLSSGSSPEDAAYREKQQSLANMASFLAGRTPTSQFGSLSGAQQGAAPVPQGGSGAVNLAPGAPGQAQQAGLQSYGTQVRALANNVSPWFAGLNLAVQGAGVAGKAGWQPFQQN